MNKVFISHSTNNKSIATQFVGYLEHIGVRHNNIFCSSQISQGAKNGEELNSKIGKAIKKTNLVIYLISQDFLQSIYCIEELGVGWYLAQEHNKKCFYIILPDVSIPDLVGFVNGKIQKFTCLNISNKDSFIALSEDICSLLRIRSRNLSAQMEYINGFFNAIVNDLNALVERKQAIEKATVDKKNEIDRLQKTIKDKDNTIKEYQERLTKQSNALDNLLLKKEFETIQKNFFILGSPHGIAENQYKCLSKSFWFDMINRYEELTQILSSYEKNYSMEILIASIYTIENNKDKAYSHYINYIKNCNTNIYYYYLEPFLNKFKISVKEMLEILKQKIDTAKDGIVKDSYIESYNLLIKREKELGFSSSDV